MHFFNKSAIYEQRHPAQKGKVRQATWEVQPMSLEGRNQKSWSDTHNTHNKIDKTGIWIDDKRGSRNQ